MEKDTTTSKTKTITRYIMENTKCTENARITLPWGGKLLNYCPVHANQIVVLGNAIGNTVQAQLLPPSVVMECESNTPLTDEEKEFNKNFPPKN